MPRRNESEGGLIICMYFVYVLKSRADQRSYVGFTADLDRRLKDHNSGRVDATSNRMPLDLVSYFAFNERSKAAKFERYLKTGSGRVFLTKRIF